MAVDKLICDACNTEFDVGKMCGCTNASKRRWRYVKEEKEVAEVSK